MAAPSSPPVRDLVGYGGKPPTFSWPNGCMVAVNFVINYEEGAERSVLNGDEESEQFLSEVVGIAPVRGDRCPQVESMYEYGARAGFWRLRRIFHEASLPYTAFAVASALERNAAVVAALRDDVATRRCEVATHGYRWIDYRDTTLAQERADTARAVRVHAELLGTPPVGCYIGRTSPHSAQICAELGFLYDADSYADDFPYYTQPLRAHDGTARDMLVVPYTLDVNDMKFLGNNGFTESTQFYQYLRDQLDVMLREAIAQCSPMIMSVGLHCRITGKPARAAGLMRFIEHLRMRSYAWCATRREIAEYWLRKAPPPSGATFYTSEHDILDRAKGAATVV